MIWLYSLKYKVYKYKDLQILFEYLSKNYRMRKYLCSFFHVGNELCSKQSKIPYFEYFPLINSRIHALGSNKNKQIMNYNLREQYQSFLQLLIISIIG